MVMVARKTPWEEKKVQYYGDAGRTRIPVPVPSTCTVVEMKRVRIKRHGNRAALV